MAIDQVTNNSVVVTEATVLAVIFWMELPYLTLHTLTFYKNSALIGRVNFYVKNGALYLNLIPQSTDQQQFDQIKLFNNNPYGAILYSDVALS
jgi:hypothetical protein